ncbi:MAG: transposase, partial [Chloroflexi bacterium]|nr:transposase [Chloroflexota bacterium]
MEQAEAKATLPRWPLLKAEERLTSKQNARLEGMRVCFPTIAEHHWLKERVRGLYRCATRQAAVDHWHNLLVNMEAFDAAAVFLWAKTLRSWGKETLGYFTLRITNGYTEGCHTKI